MIPPPPRNIFARERSVDCLAFIVCHKFPMKKKQNEV
jgi:hypothetical protein